MEGDCVVGYCYISLGSRLSFYVAHLDSGRCDALLICRGDKVGDWGNHEHGEGQGMTRI